MSVYSQEDVDQKKAALFLMTQALAGKHEAAKMISSAV
jgi:hypothetical protein